ncbi:hypothetical protein ACFL0I_00140 [Gemmatimonadota bacterium]
MAAPTMDYPDGPKSRFGQGEIIAGSSGLLLVALMFIPWFVWMGSAISITFGGETSSPGGNLSAWQFFEGKAHLFLATALLTVFLALFRRNLPSGLGAGLSLVVAGLGLVLAGLTVMYIAAPPLVDGHRGSMTIMDVESAPALGAYLGVLVTLGIAVGGSLSFRSGRKAG